VILPHIVFGCGISRALVADVGVIMAASQRDLRFASMGGISGGAVTPLLHLGGVPVYEIKELVLAHDLKEFLSQNYRSMHLPRLIWRVINNRRYERTLPSKGLYSTEKLADFIESYVSVWPEKYWTMAYCPRVQGQIIFTKNGVFKRTRDGNVQLLDSAPAPVGLAIRATCAVPGFFDSVKYTTSTGETFELFDGFVSWDGYCPAALVENFYGVERQSIIACDVVQYKTPNRLLDKGYMAVLTPNPPFPAHAFNPSRAKKSAGVAAACMDAHSAFAKLALTSV
jgi:predicted acylesterase/phospholipase RssA